MRFVLLLLFVCFASLVSAQNLTWAQLIELKSLGLGKAGQFMTANGWEYTTGEASKPEEEKMGNANFAYKKDENGKMESFLRFYFSGSGVNFVSRVQIAVKTKKKYDEYLSAIKNNGCRFISSKEIENEVVTVYRDSSLTFEITAKDLKNKEKSPIYFFFIAANKDYITNVAED